VKKASLVVVVLLAIAAVAGPVLYARMQFDSALQRFTELQIREIRACGKSAEQSEEIARLSQSMCEGKYEIDQCAYGNHYYGQRICEASDAIYEWQDMALVSDDKRNALMDLAIAEIGVELMCDTVSVLQSTLRRAACVRAEDDLDRMHRRVDRAEGF
jgi:hypothetical protein